MNERIHILNYWPNLPEKYQDLIKWEEQGDLLVFNYTEECNWSGKWDHVTRQTRGLIVNKNTLKVIAYPFDKFGNLNQFPETMIEALPKIPFEVTEKIDGAMGVLFEYEQDGQTYWQIATRGSFKSEEAIWATKWLVDRYPLSIQLQNLVNPKRYTYIFEICAEGTQFRHVAAKKPGLYLIGMRDLYTLNELMPSKVREHAINLGFPYPASFDKSVDELLEESKHIEATQCEGWVLHYENGLKVKIKGYAYMRLARFLQTFSPMHVFDMVMEGETPPDDLPADLYKECSDLSEKFKAEFLRRLQLVDNTYKGLEHIENRKEFALAVKGSGLPERLQGALFQKKDGKFEPRRMWEGMKKDEVWKTL